jgi:predicted nucleic acid-binding protein
MLVDTSVWIDYFNGHASSQANRLAVAIADGESIVIPGLVLTEILLGLRSETETNKIAGLLSVFDLLEEPNPADYIEAARIYRICRSKGYTIRSTIDCIIVQLCLRDNWSLLCKDRDFINIAKCLPLQLVTVEQL